MKTIGLLDVDGKLPNLALMKIANHHKIQGDYVEWYTPFNTYDVLYMAKVFSFTPDYGFCINNAIEIIKGGTGYDVTLTLPKEIDRLQPDYSIYDRQWDSKTALGFLTRGCPNKCKWCIVPQKEGNVMPYMDIEQICTNGRNKAVLMDNNILASEYGISQLEKIAKLCIKVDFNQGLDARLVTPKIAKVLAQIKWIDRIRFGCDTPQQIKECERAMGLIDYWGYTGEYFLYCILMDFDESFSRINYWKQKSTKRYLPYAQPYRDYQNPRQIIPQWQKDLSHWVNRKQLFKSCEFSEFEPRKGFKCSRYFSNPELITN